MKGTVRQALGTALAGACLLIVTGATGTRPAADQALDGAYVPGELIVKITEGTPSAAVTGMMHALNAREIEEFPGIRVRHWRLGKGLSVEKALEILSKHPAKGSVEYAEPNYWWHLDEIPNDPLRGELWSLHNIGQTGGTLDADVDAFDAWSQTTGDASVVVAVIDTGIDFTHPDLAANIDPRGKDFVNGDDEPIDDNGHGTHVSGTIGAVGNDGNGIVGMAWNVRILPLKAFNAGGSGTTTTEVAAIQYATSLGVPIMSASWGGDQRSRALQDAIAASGALFVASAGNSGSTTKQYPAGYDLANIVSVAATDKDDQLAGFSNRGAAWVDLGAPGVDVFSAYRGGGYSVLSGTSMAAPHVSGVAALVKAASPAFSALDLKAAILTTVDPLPSLQGLTFTGGRLNAARAVGATPAPPSDVTPPEPVTLSADVDAITTSSVTLEWTAPYDAGGIYLYDLRYSTASMDWANATPAAGEPLPGVPGTVQTSTLTDLSPGTTYFVAMRVMDEAGNPSPISNVLEVTTTSGPHWDLSVLPETGGISPALAYAPEPDGRPSIVFSYGGSVKLATWDPLELSWIVQTVGPGGGALDLAYDPNDGFPSVSYDSGYPTFAHWTGSTWTIQTVERASGSNDLTSLAYGPALAPGQKPLPSMTYRILKGKSVGLKFARWNGSAWVVQTVDSYPARYSSLAYDQSGNPAIAYSTDLDGDGRLDTLQLARWNGTTWDKEIVETGQPGFACPASLAFDPTTGNPTIAHGTSLRFVRKVGANWEGEPIAISGGSGSLAYDATGTPVVSYLLSFGEVRVARREAGGTWATELVEKADSFGRTDIAFHSGMPSLVYIRAAATPDETGFARWVPE